MLDPGEPCVQCRLQQRLGSSARSSSHALSRGVSSSGAPSRNSMLRFPPSGKRTSSMGSNIPGC